MPVFETSIPRISLFASTRRPRQEGCVTPAPGPLGLVAAGFYGALLAFGLAFGSTGMAQQPPPDGQSASPDKQQISPTQAQPAPPQTNQPAGDAPAHAPPPAPEFGLPKSGTVTEDELKRVLVGKPLYLRGGYLDDNLSFDERGALMGHSPQGSYTLCAIRIDRVRLNKHRLEVEGVRYGLHFLANAQDNDPTHSVDQVRITPKKKVVKITIAREEAIASSKKKEKGKGKDNQRAQGQTPPPNPGPDGNVTTANSPAHANKLFQDALGRVFATRVDDRMIAAMPDYWRLYYQSAAAGTDYRPADPSVMRQANVDKKAVLVSTVVPQSTELAQTNGVAGPAFYHAVIGVDGKTQQIVVARPIGFGLDENAVEAIRKASFEPAIKDGKPVPVLLDLSVQFHIYSKRTAAPGAPVANEPAPGQQLPGPYSVPHP